MDARVLLFLQLLDKKIPFMDVIKESKVDSLSTIEILNGIAFYWEHLK